MTETALAFLISIAVLGALALWVPFLDGCHGCLHKLNLLRPRPERLRGFDDDLETDQIDRAA